MKGGGGGVKIKHRHLTQGKHTFILGLKVQNILFTASPHKNSEIAALLNIRNVCKKGQFDEFISPDEGLFERNMSITKHKSHLSDP